MMKMKKKLMTFFPFQPLLIQVPAFSFSTCKKATIEVSLVINPLTTKVHQK